VARDASSRKHDSAMKMDEEFNVEEWRDQTVETIEGDTLTA
jgi:hypothetical protein